VVNKDYVYYVDLVLNFNYFSFQKQKENVLIECHSRSDASEKW